MSNVIVSASIDMDDIDDSDMIDHLEDSGYTISKDDGGVHHSGLSDEELNYLLDTIVDKSLIDYNAMRIYDKLRVMRYG